MSPSRVTQKDIAARLKLTQAAVSLALADNAGISKETRELVQQTAQEMGYVVDPYLSGLSAYRKQTGAAQFQGVLSWLDSWPADRSWRDSSTFRGYFEGAAERAAERGYRVEEHSLSLDKMTAERMEKILLARNIKGLLLPPQPAPNMQLNFPFRRFSAVTFGYTLTRPQLHLAALNQYRSMGIVFHKLLELGYRRPGLAMADDSDKRSDNSWSAAFWNEQRHLPKKDRVPLLLPEEFNQETFAEWFHKHRPDVVVAIWPEVRDWLLAMGERVSETVGLALVSVPDQSGEFSGIWENPKLIGAKAVEFLIDLIHRNENDVPDVPLCVLVDGTWVPGSTLRQG